MHMNSEEPPPSFCPGCGEYMGEGPQPMPSMPNIGTGKGRAADDAYRQMESASIARAEAAGDPALKITNMKDNLREGDVAGIAPNNLVTQMAQEINGGNYFQANVSDQVALAQTGRERTNGSVALRAIQGGGTPNFQPPAPPGGGIKGSFGGGTG